MDGFGSRGPKRFNLVLPIQSRSWSARTWRWMSRTVALTLNIACLVTTVASSTAKAPSVRYEIRALVSLHAPQVQGAVEVSFVNESERQLTDVVFLLFPNRFSVPDKDVNDFNRSYVYPREEHEPGWMEILEVWLGEKPLEVQPLYRPGIPDGTAVRIIIPPLEPESMMTLKLRFRTYVPHRYGTFGIFDEQLTMIGGWYPYLAALSEEGVWLTSAPPPTAEFQVQLSWHEQLKVLLNGRQLGDDRAGEAMVQGHYLSLSAAPHWLRAERHAEGTRILFFRRPPRRTSRIALGPSTTEIMLDTLQAIVGRRPETLPSLPSELVVIEAPLRLDLTADAEGAIVVSDRALKVHELIRPFHEARLAEAVYAEVLRSQLIEREPDEDYFWVSEGLSHLVARRFMERRHSEARTVQDWIELFNIFAIVDRFETAPQIPFIDAFFERSRVVDPLRERIATYNHTRPPGRMIVGKLRELVGPAKFDLLNESCIQSRIPYRFCVGNAVVGRELDSVLPQYLYPYPAIDYSILSAQLNERDFDRFRSTVLVCRRSSRPYTELVTVRLRTVGGEDVDLHWNSRGEVALLSAVTDRPVRQIVIDPDHKLIDDDRSDNALPRARQIILDTAEVEVSSTEFGISGLVVGRQRYDYRKDFAAAGFLTNRGIGVTAGARGHWGAPIDATRYRHNLYLFYGFQALNGGFEDKSRPHVRTDGVLGSIGLRYGYTNVFSFENPTQQRSIGLFADWFDRTLGSDFEYVDWGVTLVLTERLWTHRTIGALQLLNGFSVPVGGGRVPNQGLFSLGGSRSIRGIGAEEELGRNIFLVRGELRQAVYPEVDLNLFDLLVLRRGQVRFFMDVGEVNNSAGRVYDPGEYAVGIGGGVGAFYEFMGFFPALAYLEVATRVDEGQKLDNVQILFGSRQPF